MIKEIKGDALKVKADVIAHQTNCVGVMGAGIAKQIKPLLGDAFQLYQTVCRQCNAVQLLGWNQYLYAVDGRMVCNMFAENIPTKDRVDTNYAALTACMYRLEKFCRERSLTAVMPGYIGCGLAGGDWNIVYGIIKEVFERSSVELIICYFKKEES